MRSIREQYSPYLPGPVYPSETLDVTAAQDSKFDCYVDPKEFLKLLEWQGISRSTDKQYRFIINRSIGNRAGAGEYAVDGTPDYVLQDRTSGRKKPNRRNCPEWHDFCNAFSLKPISAGYVNATQLLHPDNPMSVFSYSTNGGTCSDKFAINLVTNHIVPLDHSLDICNHKKGWSYIHQYMGRYAFPQALEIVHMERDEKRFWLGSRSYSLGSPEECEWFAKAVHKICRLLEGFGAPKESILSVELEDDKTTLVFPILPCAQRGRSLEVLSLKREDIYWKEVESPLDKDPLVQQIRHHYALVQKATRDQVSGYERQLLSLVKTFSDSLHIQADHLEKAYVKAFASQNLADVEIYKELVHSALRKTPLFTAVYGRYADPNLLFDRLKHAEL